jgi:hypothetical protein
MDARDQKLIAAELSVGVLGRGEDFLLVNLNDVPLPESVAADARSRNLFYCGALLVTDGVVSAETVSDPDAAVPMLHAALALAKQVAGKADDGGAGWVSWLQNLWELPDTRD